MAALTIGTTAAAMLTMPGLAVNAAHSAYVTEKTEAKDEIDKYFDSMSYDEDTLFVSDMETDGTTKSNVVKRSDGTVYAVRKVRKSESLTSDSFGVANADINNIYPGALLAADQNLVTGNPTPLIFRRRNIKIGIADANVRDGMKVTAIVNPTKASSVLEGINTIRQRFAENTDFAAQTTAKIEKVESEEQIKAKMNFSQKLWGELKVSAEADYQTKQQAVVVDISQVFYTINADITTSADLFADDVTVDEVKKQITNETPAVMVSSVDYGKRIVACIQTSDTSFDLKAAVEASGLGGKVKGDAEAEYKTKLAGCKVRVFVLGGSSSASGKFITTDMNDLLKIASESTGYDGYVKPVSYTTRFAKSGRIATTSYYGDTWETQVSAVRKAIPVMITFNGISKNNLILSKTVRVYGRRADGMDENGKFTYGNEELLIEKTAYADGPFNCTLDADVDFGSVRVEFTHKAADYNIDNNTTVLGVRYLEGLKTQIKKNIYFKNLIADTENTGNIEKLVIGSVVYFQADNAGITRNGGMKDIIYDTQLGYVSFYDKNDSAIERLFNFLSRGLIVSNI